MTEADPVEQVGGSGQAQVLILCDHATNIVPDTIGGGTVGLDDADMGRHIAYDIGARGVALELARLLDAPALLTRFSRLVIDPNRGEDDPTLLMRIYDGTIIPGNRHADAVERERRLEAWHRPYHAAVTTAIDAMEATGIDPFLISIHSYTPQLRGRALRPWHVGILRGNDERLALPLVARLRAEGDLCVGDNQPYAGELEGDTLSRHGTRRGLRHALIELRQDLIGAPKDQRLWGERLAPILVEAMDKCRKQEASDGR